MKRSELYAKKMADYERQFAKHQLLLLDELGPHRAIVRIGKPNDCHFLAEIVVSLSYLVVYGDIDTIAFRGGDGGPWRSQIAWLGGGRTDYEYAASKASIGTSGEIAYGHDEEVARGDLLDARRHGSLSNEAARAGFDALSDGVHAAREAIWQHDPNAADEIGFGQVVSSRVLCAIAALRCAHRLVQ